MKNFSPRAKKILTVLAQDEARKLGSKQLLPEHVILAMLKNKEGLGCAVFPKLLLETSDLKRIIENPKYKGFYRKGISKSSYKNSLEIKIIIINKRII